MPKILIVDDDPVVHLLFKRTLNQAGFELLGAMSGVQALTLTQGTRPDLILLDIMMPGKDGLTTLRELKSHDTTRDVPVIIMTANVLEYETSRAEARNAGAEALLTKPLSPAKLLAEVQKHFPASANVAPLNT